MSAFYLPPLWGSFEVQPGSRVQYFNLKLQKVQLRLRDAQVPSLPSAALQGFWFLLPPFSKSKEPYNPVGGSDSGLCAGNPVGTAMPYLFLTKHVRHSWRRYLAPGDTVMPAVIWILLSLGAGHLQALCVSLSSRVEEEFGPVHFSSSVAADQRHL